MFVERVVAAARRRLTTVDTGASIFEAAGFLVSGTDLLVVCGSDHTIQGVITKTDVVKQICTGQPASLAAPAAAFMTTHVVLCHPGDWLNDVWIRMRGAGHKNIPIADLDGRPIGVLNLRDALQILLEEAEDEEMLLRNYVMGIGYQ